MNRQKNGEEELLEGQLPLEEVIEQENKKSLGRELLEWVLVIVCGVAAAFFISNVVILNANVPSGSMEKTIMTDDRVIGLRLSYLFSEPKRGDIVMFLFPDNEEKVYIKRIIGLPGETVEIINGRVYIDGSAEPLEEPYINGEPVGNYGPYEVPEDSYFMMGDNRRNSEDSRFWVNKYVKKEKILAKAIFRYYPGFKLLTD